VIVLLKLRINDQRFLSSPDLKPVFASCLPAAWPILVFPATLAAKHFVSCSIIFFDF
jgi:hypothetical protein